MPRKPNTTHDQEIKRLHSQGKGQKLIARELKIGKEVVKNAYNRLGLFCHIGSKNGAMAKHKINATLIECKKIAKQHNRKRWGNYKGYSDLPLFTCGNRYKTRYHNDSTFRLKAVLRSRIRKVITSRGYRPRSQEVLMSIGCDSLKLKAYIESKFQDGMTWQNMGQWEIDHIVPLSSIKAKNEEEMLEGMKKLNHYTNLQPLWAEDNRRKGAWY